ncbi:hypothetical protein VNO77_20549 [Canavalia gladiata]|uniref:CBM20 domain-containing protein n=1 Tax=Canavalia gladiata TaxID=3824 RepID=A0AAN9LUJ7_CANGL
MEAIMKSCSVPNVERLGTYAPKSAAYVSNASQFFLSPNDKKGCNFPLLKLDHNKGIYPLHAAPSKTQVDLDSLMLQAQPAASGFLSPNHLQDLSIQYSIAVKTLKTSICCADEPKNIRVKFQLERICNFGEQFLVVGNDPTFGSWNPSNAVPMTWSEGHVWTVDQEIPAGKLIQFKFVLKRKQGDVVWMPGPDRILHTWENMNKITVCVDWENAQFQKIIEEDESTHSNEELKIASEMPNLAENLGRPKEMMKPNVSKVLKKSSR